MLPEEATETHDKNEVYRRRFDKMQREYFKTIVTPELIEEHRRAPQGQHSEVLERLLIYFRGQPQVDKYAITAVELFKAYRIVGLSGHRGVPPRVVEDKIYPSPKKPTTAYSCGACRTCSNLETIRGRRLTLEARALRKRSEYRG